MRNPGGYATVVGDMRSSDPRIVDHGIRHVENEVDTFTCEHCCRVVHVPPRQDAANIGGLCKQCMGMICPRCVDKGVCRPWEKQMEEREAKYEARRSYGVG